VRNIARLLGLPEEDYRTAAEQNARRDVLDASAEAVAAKIFTAAYTMADQTYAKRGNIGMRRPVFGAARDLLGAIGSAHR
jgi:hypothetical protein